MPLFFIGPSIKLLTKKLNISFTIHMPGEKVHCSEHLLRDHRWQDSTSSHILHCAVSRPHFVQLLLGKNRAEDTYYSSSEAQDSSSKRLSLKDLSLTKKPSLRLNYMLHISYPMFLPLLLWEPDLHGGFKTLLFSSLYQAQAFSQLISGSSNFI